MDKRHRIPLCSCVVDWPYFSTMEVRTPLILSTAVEFTTCQSYGHWAPHTWTRTWHLWIGQISFDWFLTVSNLLLSARQGKKPLQCPHGWNFQLVTNAFLENLRLNWFQAKAQIKRKFICWRYACCLPFDLCLCCLDFTHLSIWFFSSLVRRSKDLFQEVMRFRCREGKGARGDISYSRSYLAASSQRKPNFIYTKTPSETSCPTLSKYCVNMHMILSMTLQGYGLMRLKIC